VNLPNALTISRIVAAPFVALLPFAPTWELRFAAFWLFIAVAVTDYWDGKLARSRNLVTDLGRLLDPLADKLLLLGTFVPMFLLSGAGWGGSFRPAVEYLSLSDRALPLPGGPGGLIFPFYTPLGTFAMPWWVFAIILGREALMTIFRQAAARRGVVISAIGPAKLKTVFQWIWVGASYFWFAAATAAFQFRWDAPWWRAFALLNGSVAVLTMVIAVLLTVWSMWLYLRRFGAVLTR
jgi:phosphatidylglycerophosphate synthase